MDEEWPIMAQEDERKDEEKRIQERAITETELKTEAVMERASETVLVLPEPSAVSSCQAVKWEPGPALEDGQEGVPALNILALEYAEETAEDILPPETDLVKQEKEELSTDEDINVDYILDCLDFVKGGKAESTQERDLTSGAAVPDVPPVAVKPEVEPVPVTASAKPKPAGKRVTWNLQDADQSPVEKTGKLNKLKQSLKEGSRKSANFSLTSEQKQEFAQPAAVPLGEPAAHVTKKGPMAAVPSAGPSGSQVQTGVQDPTPGGSKTKEESQETTYMKKLHMQERAIEEVKLAIKPFYQKRSITKDEYKDILRKAVQKVCHSKSGEINPVKVANLVKAYVDKYKHTRKHKKDDGGKAKEPDTP